MNVSSKGCASLTLAASFRSSTLSTVSILFRISVFGRRMSGRRARMASTSSSRPLRASTRRATASASTAPPHADVTIARSSRRLGAKSPGVSTNTICASPSIAMPRTRARVVWTLRETIETFTPTSVLRSVDLPAFGAPISATKPQRVGPARSEAGSVMLDTTTRRPRRRPKSPRAASPLRPRPVARRASTSLGLRRARGRRR